MLVLMLKVLPLTDDLILDLHERNLQQPHRLALYLEITGNKLPGLPNLTLYLEITEGLSGDNPTVGLCLNSEWLLTLGT